nr:Uma2 family endonuclease [Halomicronema sp. CCY15110]
MVAIPAEFSSQEYLAMEQENAIRHEYRQGLVYAMAGGCDNHSRRNINLLTETNLHLRNSDRQFFRGMSRSIMPMTFSTILMPLLPGIRAIEKTAT